MSEFIPFDNKLAGLICALSPAGRRKLADEIAKELHRSQQQRIKQQKEPDGTSYQARKRQQLRAKNGRIKRTMFQKLRTSRYMKACGRNDTTVVEFTSRLQHIARVHQFGLKDRPNKHAQDVQYPKRFLLDLNKGESNSISDMLINFFFLQFNVEDCP